MGSFIITLKTINRAGIYIRRWDPAPEQVSNPFCSQHQDTHRNSCQHFPYLHPSPQSCLQQRATPDRESI